MNETKKDNRAPVKAARIAGKYAILAASLGLVGLIILNIDKVKELFKNTPDKVKSEYTIPEMIKISGGSYSIGLSDVLLESLIESNYGTREDFLNEMPQIKITINDFEISKYEINVKQFNEYLKDVKNRTIELPSKFNSENQPIINVTWNDANNYCLWLSQKTGEKYRLPSENEWEIASKGNTQNLYPWGNDNPNKNNCNFKYSFINSTIPNGKMPSNRSVFGVYNMSGNVAEWCSDWYHPNHYELIEGKKNIKLFESQDKVIRGGGWNSEVFYLRNTARYYASPNNKSNAIGFRIIKVLN